MNFKAIPPEKGDVSGIIALIKQSFRFLKTDLHQLAELVVEQSFKHNVGCVVIVGLPTVIHFLSILYFLHLA